VLRDYCDSVRFEAEGCDRVDLVKRDEHHEADHHSVVLVSQLCFCFAPACVLHIIDWSEYDACMHATDS